MAVRINGVALNGKQCGLSYLRESTSDVQRVNGEVKTYNVKDANCPTHILKCWERCK